MIHATDCSLSVIRCLMFSPRLTSPSTHISSGPMERPCPLIPGRLLRVGTIVALVLRRPLHACFVCSRLLFYIVQLYLENCIIKRSNIRGTVQEGVKHNVHILGQYEVSNGQLSPARHYLCSYGGKNLHGRGRDLFGSTRLDTGNTGSVKVVVTAFLIFRVPL